MQNSKASKEIKSMQLKYNIFITNEMWKLSKCLTNQHGLIVK